MGVTLERVQNKFACIIGELCSEPVVLSQFAIWLDLRLAEYKAKGAISLDCSGDDPDPEWMNGHRLPNQKSSPQDRQSQPGRYGQSSPVPQHRDVSWSRLSAERGSSEDTGYDQQVQSDNLPSVHERLSPVVKEEPVDSDNIFPISLHRHDMSDMSNRKRTATESIAGSHNDMTSDSQSPVSVHGSLPKLRRSTPPGEQDIHRANSDQSTNQSLMSIISGGIAEHPTETVDLTESDISIIMEYENKEGVSHHRDPSNSRPSFSSPPAAATGSSEYSARSDDSLNAASHGSPLRPAVLDPWLYPRSFPERLNHKVVRSRVVQADEKPPHTVLDIVKAVTTLERWMWNKFKEQRQVEDIPPAELDDYLAEFFQILRRPNGQRYGPASLSNYRHHLDRFLKDKKYPCSLSKSVEFLRSQRSLLNARKAVVNTGSLETSKVGPVTLYINTSASGNV